MLKKKQEPDIDAYTFAKHLSLTQVKNLLEGTKEQLKLVI